jgi:hypothetical protein
VSWPSGLRSGDVAIAVITSGPGTTAASTPGWTLVTSAHNTVYTTAWAPSVWVFHRTLTGSERGDIGDFAVTSGERVAHTTVAVFRGVDPSAPVDAVGRPSFTYVTPYAPTSPGVVTTVPGAVVVSVASGAAVSMTPATSSFTEVVSRDNVFAGEHMVFAAQATPGPSGTIRWTTSSPSSTGWFASVAFALRPNVAQAPAPTDAHTPAPAPDSAPTDGAPTPDVAPSPPAVPTDPPATSPQPDVQPVDPPAAPPQVAPAPPVQERSPTASPSRRRGHGGVTEAALGELREKGSTLWGKVQSALARLRRS